FTFYMMLDSPRFGARGNYGGSTGTEFVQDLYVGYQPFPDINIEAGFLYMPLTRGSLASNTQVQAVEGPGDILFYPLARGSRETGRARRRSTMTTPRWRQTSSSISRCRATRSSRRAWASTAGTTARTGPERATASAARSGTGSDRSTLR